MVTKHPEIGPIKKLNRLWKLYTYNRMDWKAAHCENEWPVWVSGPVWLGWGILFVKALPRSTLFIFLYDLIRQIEGIFFLQIIVANASFSRKKLLKITRFGYYSVKDCQGLRVFIYRQRHPKSVRRESIYKHKYFLNWAPLFRWGLRPHTPLFS